MTELNKLWGDLTDISAKNKPPILASNCVLANTPVTQPRGGISIISFITYSIYFGLSQAASGVVSHFFRCECEITISDFVLKSYNQSDNV